MDSLLQACSSGNADQLSTLLANPTSKEIALAHENRAYNAVRISIPNLRRLLERAAKSGHASSVETLLDFAHANNVAYEELLTRDSLHAALDGGNLDVLKAYVRVMPATVSMDLGHLNDPLSQTLHRQLFDHTAYLLSQGADPNSRCAGHKGSGYHLRLAAQKLPLEYTTVLLRHGARVPQSGALHMAAEKGRLEHLKALVERGGDVDERLEPDVGFLSHQRKLQLASETPLLVAVRCGQKEVVRWLLGQGASTEVKDSTGKTAGMLAEEGGDDSLLELFQRS